MVLEGNPSSSYGMSRPFSISLIEINSHVEEAEELYKLAASAVAMYMALGSRLVERGANRGRERICEMGHSYEYLREELTSVCSEANAIVIHHKHLPSRRCTLALGLER